MTALQTSLDITKIFSIKKIEDRTARFEYFVNTSSQDMLHYINPTLEDSEFDVAMIHVGAEDTLNCQSDINQFNNPTKYRKHSQKI